MRPEGCTCQYGTHTPDWYISIKYCPVHKEGYNPGNAPDWAATDCGEGGKEVIRDKAAAEKQRQLADAATFYAGKTFDRHNYPGMRGGDGL